MIYNYNNQKFGISKTLYVKYYFQILLFYHQINAALLSIRGFFQIYCENLADPKLLDGSVYS